MFNKILMKEFRFGNSFHVPLVNVIWFLLALAAVTAEMARGLSSIDNFLIFRGVFEHVVAQKNIFIMYPDEYISFNNYGPAFSVIIAPFALLPVYIGCFLWVMANATALFAAIRMLPISKNNQTLILWLTALEMMTSLHSVQFNPGLTALFIFALVYTLRGKEWLATLCIAIAIVTKLYGVAGLVFFFFSENKRSFVLYLAMWIAVFFFLPMLYSSYDYIIQTYQEWYAQIIMRNQQNIDGSAHGGMQDLSVQGMIRRVFHYQSFPDLVLLAAVAVLYTAPLLLRKQLKQLPFQLYYLGITLISIVIFSTAAESPTFVIAVAGCGIWLVFREKPLHAAAVVVVVLLYLLTILSPTDLVPFYIRENFIKAYSLKVLAPFIIWCWMIYELWTKDFSKPVTV